ncbi:MAG: HEAT repeat domain-containing protein [Phycisphaerae bacterium]
MIQLNKQQLAISAGIGGGVILLLVLGFTFLGGDEDVINRATSGSEEQRLAAAGELGNRDSRESARTLADQVQDRNTQIAVRSIVSLRRHERVREHSDAIVKATRDQRPQVREAAAAAMPSLKEKADRPVLRNMITNRREESTIRAAAASSLGKLQDWDSIPTLIDALSDPNPLVRGRAHASLVKITGRNYGFKANAPLSERNRVIARLRAVNWEAQRPAHEAYMRTMNKEN